MTSAVAECRDPSSNPMQGTISFSLLLFAIEMILREGRHAVITFIDYSAAFDTESQMSG